MEEDKDERSKDKGERRIKRQIRVKDMQKRLQMALGKRCGKYRWREL